MAKYYAVKKGHKTGIFTSWTDTKTLVHGYKGALYKSFSTKEDALAYLNDETTTQKQPSELEAYVDGSFDIMTGYYGSGIVILKNDTILKELSISGNDERFIDSYQIAGEVIGCLSAIQWAIDNQYKSILISYDYEGIHSWATGNWQAKKPISQYYKRKFDTLNTQIHVYFNKVKAHSGVTYNERADELAKLAIKNSKE